MFSRRLKTGYFVLEGMNSFATVYFLYYFYFYMQKGFGFDNRANLALAAVSGGVYAVFSWLGGRFAQRFGYFPALKLGFLTMMASLAVGLQLTSAAGEIAVMLAMVIGMCFIWPTLEALVSEGEPAGGVQQMVGVYNIVWAGTAAVSYFIGGALLENLGPKSLFYIPIGIQVGQLGLTLWLEAQARRSSQRSIKLSVGALECEYGAVAVAQADVGTAEREPAATEIPPGLGVRQSSGALGTADVAGKAPEDWRTPKRWREVGAPAGSAEVSAPSPRRPHARSFLRMAWLTNPFAYIAINTLVATMPGVADRLKLSTMLAGFCCSVWCFARLGAFFALWFWDGWHYRFRWLLLAYLTLIGTFASILLTPSLAVLVLAQIAFGGAIGLIYYSSLFYSMDLSDTKGEHGGIHEAAIGLGNCAGPLVGAAALQFVPQYTNSGAVAVTLLLLGGLGALGVIWRKGRRGEASQMSYMVK